MEQQQVVVNELNAFLKGQYMGIHAYEEYIQNEKDPQIKKELQSIQQDHKLHAMRVAERIQNLGGRPVDDVDWKGHMAEFMQKLKGFPKETDGILQGSIIGENCYGIKMSEKIVRGDLDPDSMQLIEDILDRDRKHVDRLRTLLH